MQTIQASDAKTKFLSILDEVERGSSIIGTRHGEPIARIVPELAIHRQRVARAIAGMRALRQRIGKVSLDQILSAPDEGRPWPPFVLHASVMAVWAPADEPSRVADRAADELETDLAPVPHLWWYEIRNTIPICQCRGRITPQESSAFFEMIHAYPIRIAPTEDEIEVWTLARKHRLPFDDAAYLRLALVRQLSLAILDTNSIEAARQKRVPLLE